MGFELSPRARKAGYRLEAFETIDSTNATAIERALAGDPGMLWLVSPHQQAGRGRRGRAWQTESGNLAATLLLVPDYPLRQSAMLGFVAGLSLAEALEAVVPEANVTIGVDGASTAQGRRFELKWPNDVMAGSAKLSGILLESVAMDKAGHAVAIGIGVNVVAAPMQDAYPTTSLRRLGIACDAQTLFLALSDAWAENYQTWLVSRDMMSIRDRWLARAAGIGGPVAVDLGGRIVRGVFETIDDQGRFVVREKGGNVTNIAAGDVHFGIVASEHAMRG